MSLASHDRSLKYLLAQQPADFIRFGLQSATVQVLRPVESDLPARDRLIDGGTSSTTTASGKSRT